MTSDWNWKDAFIDEVTRKIVIGSIEEAVEVAEIYGIDPDELVREIALEVLKNEREVRPLEMVEEKIKSFLSEDLGIPYSELRDFSVDGRGNVEVSEELKEKILDLYCEAEDVSEVTEAVIDEIRGRKFSPGF